MTYHAAFPVMRPTAREPSASYAQIGVIVSESLASRERETVVKDYTLDRMVDRIEGSLQRLAGTVFEAAIDSPRWHNPAFDPTALIPL